MRMGSEPNEPNRICSMCNGCATVDTIGLGMLCDTCYDELEDSYLDTGMDMDFEEFMGTSWLD